MKNKIKFVGIFPKIGEKRALRMAVELSAWLKEKKVTVLSGKKNTVIKRADLLIVLGGDGSLLSIAHSLTKPTPILGVNLGDFGFITELNAHELYPVLEQVLKGQYALDTRTTLEIQVLGKDKKKKKSFQVLNEIVVSHGPRSRMIGIETYIDNQYVMTVRGDGLIVATPTGSTAYSLAAGGPIVNPKTNSIIVTPICPHTLTNRPLIIPNTSMIHVKIVPTNQQVTLTLDGQEIYHLESLETVLVKKGPTEVPLIKYPSRNYYDILRTKLHLGMRGTSQQ